MIKFVETVRAATIIAVGIALPAFAAQTVITDDGREVTLKNDGSWEFRSNDRFATAADGTRVRLKEDGSWETVERTRPIKSTAAPVIRQESISASGQRSYQQSAQLSNPVNATVLRVENQVYHEKRQKNSRYDTRTVFYLAISVPADAPAVQPKLSRFNLFEVEDSRGKNYQILDISPQADTILPGSTLTLSVTVDGSPTGVLAFGANSIELTIDRSVFGTADDLEFSTKVAKMVEREMDEPFNK